MQFLSGSSFMPDMIYQFHTKETASCSFTQIYIRNKFEGVHTSKTTSFSYSLGRRTENWLIAHKPSESILKWCVVI